MEHLNEIPQNFLELVEILRITGLEVDNNNFNAAKINMPKIINILSEIGKKDLLPNDKVNQLIAEAYIQIGSFCQKMSEYDEALENLNKALDLFNRSNLQFKVCETLMYIGMLHYNWSFYNKAKESYNKSLSLANDIGYIKLLYKIYFSLGEIYELENNHKEALNHYRKSMNNLQHDCDKKFKNNLFSRINRLEGKKHKTKLFPNFSDLFRKRSGVDTGEHITQLDKEGEEHLKNKEYKKALKKFTRALYLAEKLSDELIIGHVSHRLGCSYALLKNYILAIEYFERSIKINTIIKNEVKAALSKFNLAGIYWDKEEDKKAGKLFVESFRSFLEFNELEFSLSAIQSFKMLFNSHSYPKEYQKLTEINNHLLAGRVLQDTEKKAIIQEIESWL